MARGRWALAPGGRVAHWWRNVSNLKITARSGCGLAEFCNALRPPGDAPRCKRCERAKAKPGRRRN